MTPCEHTDDAGAYVLGALKDAEAAAFAAHLGGCDACRREVQALQVVADTLPLAAPVMSAPPELKSRIMAVVESEAALLRAAGPDADRAAPARPARRRTRLGGLRPALAAVAAFALLGLGVAAGLLLGRDEGTVRVVQAQVSIPGAAAVLTVQGHHGRLHTLRFPRPAPGRVYELWLQRERGSRLEPTSELFTVDRDGTASVDVPGDLRHVARIMVTAEPRGGSRVPSGPPVLTVTPA